MEKIENFENPRTLNALPIYLHWALISAGGCLL